MLPGREDYVAPVGFAREPVAERRRWIGRIFLLIVVIGLSWLLWNRVINPPSDSPRPTDRQSTLPAPI